MFHANPDIFKENDTPHPFRKGLFSKQIWERDDKKFKTAEKNGFKVLVIWDSEFRYKGFENKEKLINKCLNFLKQK